MVFNLEKCSKLSYYYEILCCLVGDNCHSFA